MTKAVKLYQKLLNDPSLIISFRDFERLLAAGGFANARTVGSHRHYVHPAVSSILTIQPDGKDAHRYQVRRFLAIMQEFDLSIHE